MAVPELFPEPPLDWIYPLVVGQDWPKGNEDLARQAAQAWTDALAGLVQLADSGNVATGNVNYSVQGVSSDVFNGYWNRYVEGDNSYLGQQAQQCQQFVAYLLDFAQQLEYTKLSINIQLAVLLVQVAWDLLLAPFTEGLSMAEAMLATFMARTVVRFIVARLFESVLFMTIPDLLTQVIQLANGHASSLDLGRLGTDALMGVVAGAIGAGLGVATMKGPMAGLLRDAGQRFGADTAALVSAMAQGAITNVGTNAVMHPADPFGNWLHAAMSGAFVGGVFHGLNQLHLSDHTVATFRDPSGVELYHGIQHPDGGYSLITPEGILAGRGTLDPDGTLTVGGRTVDLGHATFTTADGVTHVVYEPGSEPRQWGQDMTTPAALSLTGADRQQIKVPPDAMLTVDRDGRVVQVATSDGTRTAFYQPIDATAGQEGAPPVFRQTGSVERTTVGALRFFDAAGNAVSRTDFHGTVFDQHLDYADARGNDPPASGHSADAAQQQSVNVPASFDSASPSERLGAQSVDTFGQTTDSPVGVVLADHGSAQAVGPTVDATGHPAEPNAPISDQVVARATVPVVADATRSSEPAAPVVETRTSRQEPAQTSVEPAQVKPSSDAGKLSESHTSEPQASEPATARAAANSHPEYQDPNGGSAPPAGHDQNTTRSDASRVEQAGRASVERVDQMLNDAATLNDRQQMVRSGNADQVKAALVKQIDVVDHKVPRWTQHAATDVLADGKIAQMAPGEGKTIVGAMTAARFAAEGNAVWLVTSQDGLAGRDHLYYLKVLDSLGFHIVRVDQSRPVPEPDGGPTIYVGTVRDFAFSEGNGHRVPGDVAVIDEIDSVLIDQANSSYIISSGVGEKAGAEVEAAVSWAHGQIEDGTLTEARFGRVPDQRGGSAHLTEEARAQLEAQLGERLTDAQVDRLGMAALARWGLRDESDYVVHQGKVYIVDPVTHEPLFDPRTSHESRWNGGLAQALEKRLGLDVRADPTTKWSITTKELFAREPGRFKTVVGMSGTAKLAESALRSHGLGDVVEIPRQDGSKLEIHPASIHFDDAEKIGQIVTDLLARQETGQPQLLIVHDNALVAKITEALVGAGADRGSVTGVDARTLLEWGTARDAEFAKVVEAAGAGGTITVMPHFGGRGVDITPHADTFDEVDGVHKGGLSVSLSAFSDPRNTVQGMTRAGRNGSHGDAQVYVALTDDIIRQDASGQLRVAVVQYESARSSHDLIGDSLSAADLHAAEDNLRALLQPVQGHPGERYVAGLVHTRLTVGMPTSSNGVTAQQAPQTQQRPPPGLQLLNVLQPAARQAAPMEHLRAALAAGQPAVSVAAVHEAASQLARALHGTGLRVVSAGDGYALTGYQNGASSAATHASSGTSAGTPSTGPATPSSAPTPVAVGALRFDPVQHVLSHADGTPIALDARSARLLTFLTSKPSWSAAADAIGAAFGNDGLQTPQDVATAVSQLQASLPATSGVTLARTVDGCALAVEGHATEPAAQPGSTSTFASDTTTLNDANGDQHANNAEPDVISDHSRVRSTGSGWAGREWQGAAGQVGDGHGVAERRRAAPSRARPGVPVATRRRGGSGHDQSGATVLPSDSARRTADRGTTGRKLTGIAALLNYQPSGANRSGRHRAADHHVRLPYQLELGERNNRDASDRPSAAALARSVTLVEEMIRFLRQQGATEVGPSGVTVLLVEDAAGAAALDARGLAAETTTVGGQIRMYFGPAAFDGGLRMLGKVVAHELARVDQLRRGVTDPHDPALNAEAEAAGRRAGAIAWGTVVLDSATIRASPPVKQADAAAAAQAALATLARSASERATRLASNWGAHIDLARNAAATAGLVADRTVEPERVPAVEARLRGLLDLLRLLDDALNAPTSRHPTERRVRDVEKALHRLNIAAGTYDDLRARAERAVQAATAESRRWTIQQIRKQAFGLATRVVAGYELCAEIDRLSAGLADAVAEDRPAAAALVQPLHDAVAQLARATDAIAASNQTTEAIPTLPPELTALLSETAEAVSFAQRERAWRRSRILHSTADLDELARIGREKMQDTTTAELLAAQVDALYSRVRAAQRALAERAKRDEIADSQRLVTRQERVLLARVVPAGWLGELATVVGRYRDRRDHGLLDLGHLGGQDPLSTTLLASRENVRALRRQIEDVWTELQDAQRLGSKAPIVRFRLKQLLSSHNEQLPVLVADIESELATVRRKEREAAATGNDIAARRLRWWRHGLVIERRAAQRRMAAVRNNERLLKAAGRAKGTAAAMLAAAYPDLAGIGRILRDLDAEDMAPSAELFGLGRHLAGVVDATRGPLPSPQTDVLAIRTGLAADATVDVSTDRQSVDDLRRAYTALQRAYDEQQAVLDDPARLAALESRLATTRRVADGINLIAAFQAAYTQSGAAVTAALTEAEGPVRNDRLVELGATEREELARARFLAWLWKRGAERLWAPSYDRQPPDELVRSVNEALPDLDSGVRADVVAAIQVHNYLQDKGLLPGILQGQPAMRDLMRATDRERGSDLSLSALRERIGRRLNELKEASPTEVAADREVRLISAELATAMAHRQRHERYLLRLDRNSQRPAAFKAIEHALATRLVQARQALATAEAPDVPTYSSRAEQATAILRRRDEVRLLERRLAEILRIRVRLLDTALRHVHDAGELPTGTSRESFERELRRAQRLRQRLDRPMTDDDVTGRPLRRLFETVQVLDDLWVHSSLSGELAGDRRASAQLSRTTVSELERVASELGQLDRWQPGYADALRLRMAEPLQNVSATLAEWHTAQQQRRSYLVQLSEQAGDIGMLLNGIRRGGLATARLEMLRERIGRRQDALAQWSLRGPTAQPLPPDPAAVRAIAPAPARHVPGSDPLMGTGRLSPELGIDPFEWPGVVKGVNARLISDWESVGYEVERTSWTNWPGGLLPVTVSTSRTWEIEYHGATLRARETRRSTTIMESPSMMTRLNGSVPAEWLAKNIFGSPFDLPGSYPVRLPIQFHGLPAGVLLQAVFRAPYVGWETSYIPTDFHTFDHVDAVNLRVEKQRRADGVDLLPDLPDTWQVEVPAVDVATTGAPLRRRDVQTKIGSGVDLLILVQPYIGDIANGVENLVTPITIGGVVEAQITSEPKFSVEGIDAGVSIEVLAAAFAGLNLTGLPNGPRLFGDWRVFGGVGLSVVPWNRVYGRSLTPLIKFWHNRLFRHVWARQRQATAAIGDLLRHSWLHRSGLWLYDRMPFRGEIFGRLGTAAQWGVEHTPILGATVRRAREALESARKHFAHDTAGRVQLDTLLARAAQERTATSALPSGSISDNARRLVQHIDATGLPEAAGRAARAARAARDAAVAAADEVPEAIRDLPSVVRDQLAALRRDFGQLMVARSDEDIESAVAAVHASAALLRAHVARGQAAQAVERGIDAVLTLERVLAAAPPTGRPAQFADLREELASWIRIGTERLLDAASVVDEPNIATPDAVIRLPEAASDVAQRLENLAALIADADRPSPHRHALRWALAVADLRRALYDTGPLSVLDVVVTTTRGTTGPTPTPTPPPVPARPIVAQLPALRGAVRKPGFRIGMAVTAAVLADRRTAEHVLREAAALTTEDALAWSTVRPDEGHVVVDALDALVAFAQQHGLPVHGHALISPDDLPNWLTTRGRSRPELAAIMRRHITDLVSAYRGRVRSWTVVDQPLSDSGTLRDSLWRVGLGRHYIADAFRAAHAADPSAVLYLTDHHVTGEIPDKAEQFFQLVSDLRREGVPLDGVGVRLRLAVRTGPDGTPFVDWSPATVRVNLRRLAAMGLEVAISAVDVRLPDRPSEADIAAQADTYAEVVRISLEIGDVNSLTIWGASDGFSSVPGAFPGFGSATPFSSELAPKPAVQAMIDVLTSGAT